MSGEAVQPLVLLAREKDRGGLEAAMVIKMLVGEVLRGAGAPRVDLRGGALASRFANVPGALPLLLQYGFELQTGTQGMQLIAPRDAKHGWRAAQLLRQLADLDSTMFARPEQVAVTLHHIDPAGTPDSADVYVRFEVVPEAGAGPPRGPVQQFRSSLCGASPLRRARWLSERHQTACRGRCQVRVRLCRRRLWGLLDCELGSGVITFDGRRQFRGYVDLVRSGGSMAGRVFVEVDSLKLALDRLEEAVAAAEDAEVACLPHTPTSAAASPAFWDSSAAASPGASPNSALPFGNAAALQCVPRLMLPSTGPASVSPRINVARQGGRSSTRPPSSRPGAVEYDDADYYGQLPPASGRTTATMTSEASPSPAPLGPRCVNNGRASNPRRDKAGSTSAVPLRGGVLWHQLTH